MRSTEPAIASVVRPRRIEPRRILIHAIMIAAAITMVVPFLWMATTSLKNLTQAYAIPPIWIPDPVTWENYPVALFENGVWTGFVNSAIVSVSVVVGQLVIASLAAYAFARIDFPGRNALFFVFLATMMIPVHVTMIPIYVLFRGVGLLNTYPALILPALVNPFAIFLLRQFFLTLPMEMEESLFIDGGNRFQSYWHLILPLSKPGLAAVGIFAFINTWNNLLWALVAVTETAMQTLPVKLALFTGEFITNIHLQMAGATVATIPVLIVFAVLQRSFVQGVVLSGLKS